VREVASILRQYHFHIPAALRAADLLERAYEGGARAMVK
jgi:hypothetical protein